ncbi:MAG TPA: hypothetical protein GX707_16415 [Epulopiscium sp.]|nr:hypothetical protein [Candidatus Epulonipiscium sp.]
MIKKFIWPLLVVISISLALVFSVGFITSINISKTSKEAALEVPGDQSGSVTPSNENQDKNQDIDKGMDILIMGDSIGFGIGDGPGMGIGKRYTDLIGKEQTTPTQVSNISVPGYLSGDLLTLITGPENESLISAADTIIISIGGNDLNRVALEDTLSLDIRYQETLESYKENLQLIIKRIREVNPKAQLALVGLYNPYNQEQAQNARLLLEWNYETRRIVSVDSKMTYVPTYEQFEYHLDTYLAEDNFHPSSEGYQVIAEQLYGILH